MRLREQHAAIADRRRHSPAGCARIDGHALPDDAVGADGECRGLARIFPVLGCMADRREWKNPRACANGRAARNNHMRDEFSLFMQHGLGSDMAEWTDESAWAELRASLDQCERMHESGGRLRLHIARAAVQGTIFPAASEAPISASQTSTPSTLARPSNHHMLRF